MADYKKISIDVMENGFTVTVLGSGNKGKKFVFPNAKKMNQWLKENLSATGEVERFSEALDNDKKELSDSIFIGYNRVIGA